MMVGTIAGKVSKVAATEERSGNCISSFLVFFYHMIYPFFLISSASVKMRQPR